MLLNADTIAVISVQKDDYHNPLSIACYVELVSELPCDNRTSASVEECRLNTQIISNSDISCRDSRFVSI